MKPPSEDGGNWHCLPPCLVCPHSRNEATIRRWWKRGGAGVSTIVIDARNEATIRRWWTLDPTRPRRGPASPRNEATIRRWWNPPHCRSGCVCYPDPAMKPPSEDGGNPSSQTDLHRSAPPAMKPPSEDGGNIVAARGRQAGECPAMKPPSEDGGNQGVGGALGRSAQARNEATIRRWWKLGTQGERPAQPAALARNEATIRRWWKPTCSKAWSTGRSTRNEATIRRWWKHRWSGDLCHGKHPRNEATIRRWWKQELRALPRPPGVAPQ